MTGHFTNTHWRSKIRATTTPSWKLALCALARPWLYCTAHNKLTSEAIRRLGANSIMEGGGFPLEARRRWALGGRNPSGLTILVQGTGTGWDVVSWAALRPRRIIATDLFDFGESWEEIRRHCSDTYGVDVTFVASPLETHGFIPGSSIDICGSDAVFEHVRDIDLVLKETFRLLKPGGVLYATYGPLWYCAGGDHYSGRGGLEHAFNHLLLDQQEYREYFSRHLEEVEDCQSGGRYVELDLFSKLTTTEYLAVYSATGFRVEKLILEVSAAAVAFRRRYPERFARLLSKYADRCLPDDFIIKANFVRLVKPNPGLTAPSG